MRYQRLIKRTPISFAGSGHVQEFEEPIDTIQRDEHGGVRVRRGVDVVDFPFSEVIAAYDGWEESEPDPMQGASFVGINRHPGTRLRPGRIRCTTCDKEWDVTAEDLRLERYGSEHGTGDFTCHECMKGFLDAAQAAMAKLENDQNKTIWGERAEQGAVVAVAKSIHNDLKEDLPPFEPVDRSALHNMPPLPDLARLRYTREELMAWAKEGDGWLDEPRRLEHAARDPEGVAWILAERRERLQNEAKEAPDAAEEGKVGEGPTGEHRGAPQEQPEPADKAGRRNRLR